MTERYCHEMHFESCKCVKMHLRPRFYPRPRWGSLRAPPNPLAGFEGKEWGGEVKVKRRGKEREGCQTP